MDREELIERLKGYEWNDVEFKEARHAVPKDAYETVSAFANTDGGHLVFGVKEAGKDFEVVGVLSVDKVQGDFLTTLRQRDKISVVLDVKEELHRQGNADLLVFFVPEASRTEKPVYLNGDIRRSFVRRGGSDVRCSDNERDRFLIDATAERFDGRVVQCDPDTALDSASVRWYRETYERRPGNRSTLTCRIWISSVRWVSWPNETAEGHRPRLPSCCSDAMRPSGNCCLARWSTVSGSRFRATKPIPARVGWIALCSTRT